MRFRIWNSGIVYGSIDFRDQGDVLLHEWARFWLHHSVRGIWRSLAITVSYMKHETLPLKVHWKWSERISGLLIQCLESTKHMEIRNALILLKKMSGVFPVTKRSGINLEKRVARIKSYGREDLKVLATGVGADLASRKPSWVTDEEFTLGYLDIKELGGGRAKD